MRHAWRLGVVLALVAGTAAAILFAPRVGEQGGVAAFHGLPSTPAGWTVVEGAPESALPADPKEKISVRRTYRRGDQVAWTSVALFGRQDLPDRRASLNLIYPERNTTRIDHLPFTLGLNGSVNAALALPAVVIQRDQQRLLVVYWHQIGSRAYGNEYRYRLALMRSVLVDRRADMILLRIATPIDSGESLEQALGAVREIAPALHAAVSAASGR